MTMKIMCDEHKLEIKPDGSCPKCRDANGNAFVLDVQSTYLESDTAMGQVVIQDVERARAEFVNWCINEGRETLIGLSQNASDPVNLMLDCAWEAWQAARKSNT